MTGRSRPTCTRSTAVLVLAVLVCSGCGTDIEPSSIASVNTDVGTTVATAVDSAPASSLDLPEIIGAAAWSVTDSRSSTPLVAGHIQIADALFTSNEKGDVLVDEPTSPMTAQMRASIEAAYSPYQIFFEPVTTEGPMILLARPVLEGSSAVVPFEIRCGLDRGGLCAEGGAFRLQRVGGRWQTIETIYTWIS